VLSSERREM